jgi:hypothetical protein
LLAGAAVVTAFLASGCLWGIVRDARTGTPIAGATVSFTCQCGYLCGGAAMTNASGIYVIDMLPVIPSCFSDGASWMKIRKVGYVDGYYTPVFDYRDNPNASFNDLHTFWEAQDFQLVPGKWAQVELLSLDMSLPIFYPRPRLIEEAEYQVKLRPAIGTREMSCEEHSAEGSITSADPPPVEFGSALSCTYQADQLEVTVTLEVSEVDAQVGEGDVSTAGFGWAVPDGETGWLTATLDSRDAAGPDDPGLEFTAQIRYRSVTQ